MTSQLPLDDELGQTFYIAGAPWRLMYNKTLRGFALRRLAPSMPFELALEQIASGALRWDPPTRFEPLRPETSVAIVQHQVALLDAFRRSPMRAGTSDWELLARIDARIADARSWLARRALPSGDPGRDPADGGNGAA
jgi:hypothetical protein